MMNFTQEQKNEIRASYRDSKNPQKQLSILADLYACTKNDIIQVLELQVQSKRVVRSYDQSIQQDLTKAVLVDKQSVEAAAERFGIPLGTAKGWVQKAKKKQAEFMEYGSPKSPDTSKTNATHHKPQKTLLPILPNIPDLQEGLDGLGAFTLAFHGFDFITEADWQCLDEILLKAKGFIAGIEVASQSRQ